MMRALESERNEFRREYDDGVLKAVIAFANSGGGRIYIGIDGDGTVVGLENQDETSRSVSDAVSDSISPDVTTLVSIEKTECEGMGIVKVDVAEGDRKPYYWREKGIREGGVYIRKGSSCIPASESRILKMMREYSDCPYEEMVSLKQNLTFEYTRRYFEDHGLELGERQMVSLGMVERGMFTNLAFFLSDQFTQGIRMALYSDEFKSEFLDKGETKGSVLKQLEEAYDFASKHNNRRAVIRGKYRVEGTDYPESVLREAICNAIVHRDYGINGSTLLSMYDEKTTVVSIGGLNRGLELEDVLNGVSSRRNERLASVFMRLGLIENFGSGLPRIMGLYADQPSSPYVDVTANSFRITLPRMTLSQMSQEAKDVMAAFGSGQTFTRSDVEDLIEVSKGRAHEVVGELLAQGLVERRGSGPSTAYRVLRGT